MQVISVIQGTPEWHAYRAEKFNASDAPAMLGLSKYKTRTELLNERKTGLTSDVDSATQRLFDNGHKFEALARPLAEEIIGEELSPVIGSEGKLSASFDGLTLLEDTAWEHKTWNQNIADCITVYDLDEMYLVQMEQQLFVSGADKCLFTATKWNDDDQLLESVVFWYEPQAERRQRIVDGWSQFERDLESFVPTVTIEPPKAQPVLALPALFIHAKGEITTSNMKEYGEALSKRLEEIRSIVLYNEDDAIFDQNVANAKGAAKHLREGIEQAKLAKDAMLSQTVTVGEAARMIDTWCEDMRLTALQLEKEVKEQDLIKKKAMIECAQMAFKNMSNALEKDTAPIRLNISMPNFAEAIKGKSKYSAMQDAISTLVANSTVEANRVAMDIRSKQDWLRETASDYKFLFADIQTVIFKPMDDLQLLANSRIDAHKKLEAEREAKIKTDAEAAVIAKVEAEAAAKEAAEIKARQELEAQIIAEAKNDDGAVVDATFNESDFKNVFAEPIQKIANAKRPTAQAIIALVAATYKVEAKTAERWLAQSFGELKAA